MKEALKCKFPTWYKDIDKEKYYMVLSNDFDSYLSCIVLKNVFGLEIGGYFSLKYGLYLNPERTKGKEPIYVDLSITKGKCFDNHMTFITNNECINPNIIIPKNQYYKKYNGSTLAFLVSLYDRDLSKYTLKELITLIVIDGWDAGYYKYNGKYRNVTLGWMKIFEEDKYLLPILSEHDDRKYFFNFIDSLKLNKKIIIKDNHLYCDRKVKLPLCEFQLAYKTERKFLSKCTVEDLYKENPDSIITTAETFNGQYSICRKVV